MANDSFFQLMAHEAGAPLDLSPRVAQMLSASVRDAILSNNRDRMIEIVKEITLLFDHSSLKLNAEVATRLFKGHAQNSEAEIYLLGQINFAQEIAESLLARKSWSGRESLTESSKYFPYVSALYHESLTNKELAERLSVTPETVSRNLKDLREQGLTEFRREGVRVVNFLTPGAESICQSIGISTPKPDSPKKREALQNLDVGVPDFFGEIKSFATPSKYACAGR
ncbi:bacterial regulatory protein, crp family [Pseudomonas sp. GM49]|uniref:helix-turn-helix domain-containing protein n=1 Tax=Pseudomonas sp. GM49 TaxID=1144331 RepID=UPI000270CFC4|nr:helix-turn-helix domain-containing protein [Pseudomonas sp. GM49]EJM74586.1 bacterial regulatory protein, crp family [Pseudomonas sp. GM49]